MSMRFWVEKTIIAGRSDRLEGPHSLGKALWSPQKSKDGKDIYRSMRDIKPNDVVFHFVDNKALVGVSRAESVADANFAGLDGTDWSGMPSYRIELIDYVRLSQPIERNEFLQNSMLREQLEKILTKYNGLFFNRNFELNQGAYLTEAPIELVAIWNKIYQKKTGGNNLPYFESEDASFTIPETSTYAPIDINATAKTFHSDASDELVSLQLTEKITTNVVASLLSKRFLVLTGLAGSGKTKIAQAFARWITPDPGWIDDTDRSQGKNPNPYYSLVPVGADWTGNENIIGYPNGLDSTTYITKPSLELIRHALDPANVAIPHFLILDEMNLSHVERYFADILSAIESGEEVPLYEGAERTADGGIVPRKLRLPDNLFIIGTVNVDETTYMFSPKVLDRANVIEFRMEPAELAAFLSSPKAPRLEELDGKGIGFGSGFVEAAGDKGREVPASVKADYEREMLLFFNLLREHNAEFGYRTSYEAGRFIHFYDQLGGYADDNGDWFDGAMDAVIVQKLLPKLHGSRSKLEGLLWAMAWACGAERVDRGGKDFSVQLREVSQAQDEAIYGPELLWSKLATVNADDPAAAARYPLSFDKVMRMWRKLVRDQFVTFAEA